MKHFSHSFLLLSVLASLTCQPVADPIETYSSDDPLRQRAQGLAQKLIIVDTHIDVPYRLTEKMEDISLRTAGGDFDFPRAKEGGLNVAFMSIYVPARYQGGEAKELADDLIDMVEGFVQKWPQKFALAGSVAEVQRNFAEGKISLPLGMENGTPIEADLQNLRYFYDRGIRYITLTHSRVNHISDSSYDSERKWNGLSPFGRQVVVQMNRLGIMIDVSHISDAAFSQVVELSQAPVIASHSSCRHFTPGWERNVSDEMLLRLKNNGGVIQINFGSSFLDDEHRRKWEERYRRISEYLKAHNLGSNDPQARLHVQQYEKENPIEYADVSDVADHIDHVVRLIGVDHAGFGSDFDGVGDTLPNGLKDVSDYPNLIYELLKRGYSEQELEKICGGNLLRVWSEVEQTAHESKAALR